MERLKDLVLIAQSLTTILAIIVSGFWGYWAFIKNRQMYPRARLNHSVQRHTIDDNKILLHVVLTIQNIGEILLTPRMLETRIQQVLPLPEQVRATIEKGIDPVSPDENEINLWPELGVHKKNYQKNIFEVEPGEIQEIHHDFIVPGNIKTLMVYSYLKNVRKRDRDIGWDLTTFHDI